MKLLLAAIIYLSTVATFAHSEVIFKVGMHGFPAEAQYEYYVATSDPVLIAECRAQLDGSAPNRHINGAVDFGSGGFNGAWNWHHVPDDWVLAEGSMEVCDGIPMHVETDTEYFVNEVGRFCCWTSYIKEEMTLSFTPDLPAALAKLSVTPNPFNPATSISYWLKTPGSTTVRVLDPTGRCVRVLFQGVQAAGSHTMSWNGRGDSGRIVASGLFFVVVETEKGAMVARATLLK